MTTPPNSQTVIKISEVYMEDDILGIYQQLQDIAETIMISSNNDTKFTQACDEANNFNEIEGFYKTIEQKEHQIRLLIEISNSLLAKTKEKILSKEQEIVYFEKNIDILENEISQGKERKFESTEMINSLNSQKEQLEEYLSDLELGYEKTQENLFRSQEEFISLGEYKRKYQELNALLDPNNELLSFYKQTNEDLKKEHKLYKNEMASNKAEIESIRKKLASLLENYEKSIGKQTTLNKQKLLLQEQIAKIKEDIRSLQQKNTVLIKEIEKDQMKRIKGIPKINSIGFINNLKETPQNKRCSEIPLSNNIKSLNYSSQQKNERLSTFNDKLSIDFLLENEEKEKSRNASPLKSSFKKETNEEKKQENENNQKKEKFDFENFASFKNSLEINVLSQKSEEFGMAFEEAKYYKKPDLNKISIQHKKNKNKKNEKDEEFGFFNFWVIGGLAAFFSLFFALRIKDK